KSCPPLEMLRNLVVVFLGKLAPWSGDRENDDVLVRRALDQHGVVTSDAVTRPLGVRQCIKAARADTFLGLIEAGILRERRGLPPGVYDGRATPPYPRKTRSLRHKASPT